MKKTVLYKFSGAGNDFVVIDGREGDDTATAVAAHHAAGTVGVVELHGEIDRWPIGAGHDG